MNGGVTVQILDSNSGVLLQSLVLVVSVHPPPTGTPSLYRPHHIPAALHVQAEPLIRHQLGVRPSGNI